jgi:uncharacterized membrane protein
MKAFKRYFNNHILLITILITGAILRFYGLNIQSLWLDELLTWSFSTQEKLVDVIKVIGEDSTHPPMYFGIIYLIVKHLGDSEVILRLPSAISGVISIIAVFFLAKRLYSEKEGIVSALLMAVLWCPIYYSQEARAYSILLLFIILSTHLWILILWRLNINKRPTYYTACWIHLNRHHIFLFTLLWSLFDCLAGIRGCVIFYTKRTYIEIHYFGISINFSCLCTMVAFNVDADQQHLL